MRRVVGKVSDWISLDSPNDALRQRSEDALMQEVSWAMHLGLQAILLPSPPLHASNYCRSLLQFISASSYQQFWIKIPLLQPLRSNNTDVGLGHVTDGWIAWNNFRLATGHIHNIGVALELSPDLDEEDISTCKKWAAEPVKAIIIPTSMFISNKLGFPVLSRHHQVILSHFLKYKINFVFSGPSKHVPSESNLQPTGYSTYREYILFLRDRVYQSEAPLDPLIAAYRDRLQSPLQPLMDNLESQTYETFERDQIKYDQYERAILEAIRTLQERHEHTVLSTNDSSTDMNQRIEGNVMVVTVVGAGRGPLVAATLSAAKQLNQLVRIYAVEKNDNAVITLRNRVITDEWVNVTVVHSDMRHWQPPELAQIIVSELLGSWGDNELSPECLDGAQKCLDPFIGISIPYNYKSYLSPISTSRLWTGVRDMTPQKNVLNFLDTPFIVKFHNFFQIAPSQELFLFTHPNYPKPPLTIDNRR